MRGTKRKLLGRGYDLKRQRWMVRKDLQSPFLAWRMELLRCRREGRTRMMRGLGGFGNCNRSLKPLLRRL